MKEIERIKEIIKHVGLKKTSFARSLGYVNANSIIHIESGRNGISENLAKRIVERYPEFNEYWILSGKGEMLKDPEAEDPETDDPETEDRDLSERVAFLEDHIKGLNARIELLEMRSGSTYNNDENSKTKKSLISKLSTEKKTNKTVNKEE